MRYQFAPEVLLRMPVKSPGDYNVSPQIFLDDPMFRAAILHATHTFYQVLNSKNFEASVLTEKEANTLQKYINRYCYRPTPFGLFASVTLTQWLADAHMGGMEPFYEPHICPAMTVQNLLFQYLKPADPATNKLEANPSIYRVLNEYRFFRTGLDQTGSKRDYQLQSIAFSQTLKEVIAISKNGCFKPAIIQAISGATGCSLIEAEDYAHFLIDSQFLVYTHRLSITGGDPLIDLINQSESAAQSIIQAVYKEHEKYNPIDPSLIGQLEDQLDLLLQKGAIIPNKLNIILKASHTGDGPDMAYQQTLRDGLLALELLSESGQSAAMAQFIKTFLQHFDGQTLPLLLAFDPEAGAGYQSPETDNSNPLLETLLIPYKRQVTPGGNWSATNSVLMEAWLRDRSTQPQICLNDADLELLKSKTPSEQMLGMSVLFRVSGTEVFIENAGGINAPALLGRFTVADQKIAEAAKSLAKELEAQNPDVIFAELLHLTDPHTDNVNRRAHIYQYEIPVTAASTLPASRQIPLSDLYVRVVDNQVVLFSEKHQKIVVPRLTSAYNHSLNKLPLFRFLADLPYSYGRSNFRLDLRQLFPNLSFYPRVTYKSARLSLATWIISGRQLTSLQDATRNREWLVFGDLKNSIGLPRFFSLAEGDQELVFDSQRKIDVHFFCDCIRQKKEAVIKEFLEQDKVRQYNAFLLPTGPLVLPPLLKHSLHQAKAKRKYVPGSEWLYLKVYAPKIGVNRLLLRLRPLLYKSYAGHKITQWFFIRYEDHAPHIRLRLQINPASISEVLIAFKAKLEDRIQQHVIREFQIDVYSRELERYAAGGIENSERFFWASSELMLRYLIYYKTRATVSTHIFALYSTYILICEFISETDAQLHFTINSFRQFLPEFTEKPFKVDLDRKYRELSPGIRAALQHRDPALFSGSVKAGNHFRESLQAIAKQIGPTPDQNYLRSIIHMHLNRVFTDESRKQEMISYYLLHKYLLSEKGRNQNKHDAD
ncbi:thiopeptide-type bacteriocin biosynthesis protein [Mucilaginibacter rubeus]|uniref:lantibiotic dehydratase n=1 Tax=Mucilaginibacter rubeus TaxID=2027860 RepID=UPI00339AE64F